MRNIYIALGSNLDDPINQIKEAIANIQNMPKTIIINQSSLYETSPVGFLDQPNFINSVIKIETHFTPHVLLEELQKIEIKARRIRDKKNGPRTLDLDILLIDDLNLDTDTLTIPHPRMHNRPFVLIPLSEINPNINIPGFGNISNIIKNFSKKGIVKVTE